MNADRIRAMSNEELARWLCAVGADVWGICKAEPDPFDLQITKEWLEGNCLKEELPKCSCGGEAKMNKMDGLTWVGCEKCGSSTYHFNEEEDAVQAWRRIVSGGREGKSNG